MAMKPPRIDLGSVNNMLATAYKNGDTKTIGKVVDILRSHGMNYYEIQQIGCNACGIDAAEWETIQYCIDENENETA
jgi:hypothetical protein